MQNEENIVSRYIEGFKNSPILAKIIVGSLIIIGIGTVIGSIADIESFVKKIWQQGNTPYSFKFEDQEISFTDNSGINQDNAIKILGARTVDAGLAAETYWLEKYYSDYSIEMQALLQPNHPKPPFYDLFILKSSLMLRNRPNYSILEA